MAKILVVEDDKTISENVVDFLTSERHVVELVEDGQSALDMLAAYKFELIILDVQLPKLSGYEVCKRFREQRDGDTPILMLTGQSAVADKTEGLDSGADDYLTKPFDLRELSARIRALLRRPPVVRNNVLSAGDITFDTQTMTCKRGTETIKLLPKEYALLEFLLRHKNQVFSVEALLDQIWHSESESTPDAVRQVISRLRNRIDVDGQPSLITTVVGLGYTIESD